MSTARHLDRASCRNFPFRSAALFLVVLVAAGCVVASVKVESRPSGDGKPPSSTGSSSTARTTTSAGIPAVNGLISCSGPSSSDVSFDGMRVDETLSGGPLRLVKDFEVEYRGKNVFRSGALGLIAGSIPAPGTSGNVCIAGMAGYRKPIALARVVGASLGGASELDIVYPVSGDEYVGTEVGFPGVPTFDIRELGGSLAIVGGDRRFLFLFTDDAGSNSPIRVLRFEGGGLVDVSSQFPQLIAADAARLISSTRQPWYRADGVDAFIGVLEAWIADECRLGNAAQAWRSAERQVRYGTYHRQMAVSLPNFIQQLRADLGRWGYCPSGG